MKDLARRGGTSTDAGICGAARLAGYTSPDPVGYHRTTTAGAGMAQDIEIRPSGATLGERPV
jgi:hypothetical protein